MRRLVAAYAAFNSGWPQPDAERLSDSSQEPPLQREADVGRIPDARVAELAHTWNKGLPPPLGLSLSPSESEAEGGSGGGGVGRAASGDREESGGGRGRSRGGERGRGSGSGSVSGRMSEELLPASVSARVRASASACVGEGVREYGETEALVYVAARMPSTYAAITRVL